MKLLCFYRLALAFAFTLPLATQAGEAPDPRQVEISVGQILEQGHYSRKKLDDSVSRALLKNYIETLDYTRLFFTQKDVDGFNSRYGTTLDDDILLGNPEAAYKIYELYKQRVEGRVAKVKASLADDKFDFTGDGTVELNRQKAPWPKDEDDSDKLWRNRLEGELLQETLAQKTPAKAADKSKIEAPAVKLSKRYDQLLRNLHEQTSEDILKIFLSTLAQTYDPHSEYMSRTELENFSINMRLSLVGIGAVLNSEDGYAKIMELVPGGPAAKDGRLKVGDRVTGVAQGDKDFVETVDMKLDKVVEMIRGKEDTIVRLQVIPVSATDPAARKVIEIKREKIKLKDQEAKAEIVDRALPDGSIQRLGWITLPSFYADMEHSGSASTKSTTRDVLALLTRLKSEGITGLVMDLRRNGGGSLEEAVNLTGLFIKKGAVVQSKDSNGHINVSRDRDSSVAYDGPMIVLTNRLSASASEIFAAALQDYNRAVIVGDQNTFGKGTVQTMLEIGRIRPFLGGGSDAGALKLTIQKFYRVAGGSTQLHGVASDVKLPSMFDQAEIGESSLKGPLPYDTVDPVPYDRLDKSLFKPDLVRRSAARVEADPEFKYINEDLERIKKRTAENRISLNEKVRRAEIDEDKKRRSVRLADRASHKVPDPKVYIVNLDNVNKPELQLASVEEKKAAAGENSQTTADDGTTDESEIDAEETLTRKRPAVDPVRNEALNILADLIDFVRTPKTASK
jgi:carboxyl-terminal processing protease